MAARGPLNEVEVEVEAAKAAVMELLSTTFKSGVWVKTVENIDTEMEILRARATCPTEHLEEDGELSHAPEVQKHPESTEYSTATFCVTSLPISVCLEESSGSSCGIILRYASPPVHFYDGCDGPVTKEDINFTEGEFNNGRGEEHQLRHPSCDQVKELLTRRWEEIKGSDYDSEDFDATPSFPSNKGLLCYGRDDILGICVSISSLESCHSALLLRQKLLDAGVPRRNLSFFSYHRLCFPESFTYQSTRAITDKAREDCVLRETIRLLSGEEATEKPPAYVGACGDADSVGIPYNQVDMESNDM